MTTFAKKLALKIINRILADRCRGHDSSEEDLSILIDAEFQYETHELIRFLERIVESAGCRPGHIAYLNKTDIGMIANTLLRKFKT